MDAIDIVGLIEATKKGGTVVIDEVLRNELAGVYKICLETDVKNRKIIARCRDLHTRHRKTVTSRKVLGVLETLTMNRVFPGMTKAQMELLEPIRFSDGVAATNGAVLLFVEGVCRDMKQPLFEETRYAKVLPYDSGFVTSTMGRHLPYKTVGYAENGGSFVANVEAADYVQCDSSARVAFAIGKTLVDPSLLSLLLDAMFRCGAERVRIQQTSRALDSVLFDCEGSGESTRKMVGVLMPLQVCGKDKERIVFTGKLSPEKKGEKR